VAPHQPTIWVSAARKTNFNQVVEEKKQMSPIGKEKETFKRKRKSQWWFSICVSAAKSQTGAKTKK
jgi:hypothetical protein